MNADLTIPSRDIDARALGMLLGATAPNRTPQERREAMIRGITRLHASLDTLTSFRRAVASAACFVPAGMTPLLSRSLATAPSLRINLVGVHRNKPVPAHDHPGSHGAQLVISGRLRAVHYDPDDTLLLSKGHSHLVLRDEREYGPGDICTHLPREGNIHALDALSDNLVLLTVQLPACDEEQRSWYFPLAFPADDALGITCIRLQRRTAVPIRDRLSLA